MNIDIMKKTTEDSMSGKATFPQVVQTLLQEGVESYRVDLVQKKKSFIMPDGQSFSEEFHYAGPAIASEFSQEQVIAAIRASQTGQINYQEFLKRILTAGTTDYTVYLQGKRVVYVGRKGDFHIEHFPQK